MLSGCENSRMRTRVTLNLGKSDTSDKNREQKDAVQQLFESNGWQRDKNREQKDAVQQLFESNGWPWNFEVSDVCETENTALPTSLNKPRPFVFRLSSLQSF